MNNINLIYIIPLLLTLTLAVYSLIKGKNASKNRINRNFIVLIVLSIILSTLFIDTYYEKELEVEKNKLINLFSPTELNDSILIDSDLRQKQIDSLMKQNQELMQILVSLKNKEKIIGEQSELKSDINNKIRNNKIEIGVIEKYNQILDRNLIDKWKGTTSTGFTTNFSFDCPTDFDNDSLVLKLQFRNEKIIPKIQFIYVTFAEKIKDYEYNMLFDQIYLPQKGVNGFRVENYFKLKKKVDLEVGYILKTESKKDYPTFERIVCRNY